jgi:hypothetical protein
LSVEHLVVAYPDADVVFLHRDAAKVVPSLCSLVGTMTDAFSDADHDAHIARRWSGFVATTTERVRACAAAHPDRCFLDIAYDDLMADPLAVVEKLYAGRGETLSDEAAAAMQAWLARPDTQQPRHRYRPNPYLDGV